MQEIKIAAHGKVNLSLNITGVRDNMHTLESVVACVDLCDTVNVRFNRDGNMKVLFEGAAEAIPQENSVTKAMRFLQTKEPKLGAEIAIVKKIPMAAGLGGSSADAAAVVRAAALCMPEIFGGDDTVRGSVAIGSDVPVLVSGGCVLMSGAGEELRAINCPTLNLCLACGKGGVSSGDAYKLFDELYPDKKYCPTDTDALINALGRGDIFDAARLCGNALTKAACKLCGDVEKTLAALKSLSPLTAFMTGSGNCCVAIYESAEQAKSAAQTLESQGLWARYACTSK